MNTWILFGYLASTCIRIRILSQVLYTDTDTWPGLVYGYRILSADTGTQGAHRQIALSPGTYPSSIKKSHDFPTNPIGREWVGDRSLRSPIFFAMLCAAGQSIDHSRPTGFFSMPCGRSVDGALPTRNFLSRRRLRSSFRTIPSHHGNL